MNFKNIISFALILFAVQIANAEEFKILNFYENGNDLAARKYERQNINGQVCALIKVRTDLTGLNFSTNLGIVGDVVKKDGDYWVYVSPGEQRIKFIKEGYLAKPYNLPLVVESSNVYVLELTGTGEGEILDQNLIKTTFRFNTPQVYIAKNNGAPVQANGKVAEFRLPKGTYYFRFSKEEFKDVERDIVIEEEQLIDVDLESGQKEQSLRLPGIITINSEPSEADIFLNNQKIGQTPYTGQVIAGNYDLSLKIDLYHTYRGSFSLSEGESKELPKISLKPKFGYITILSEPLGAEISLDGKFLGNAPFKRQKIESGKHVIEARMDMYHTQAETITIEDGDDAKPTFTLKPAFGKLIVESEPKGAKVFLDGRQVGTTPYRDERVLSGNYELKVTQPLWSEETETISINDEETTKKMMVLNKNFGEITVEADNSTILKGSEIVGENKYTAKLKPGRYTFTARREKHNDDSRDVFISVGDHRHLLLKPEPRRGSVSIITDPTQAKGAEIFVDNQPQKKTAPAVIALLEGDYDITLRKKGYLESSRRVSVEEGESKQVTFKMQTYKGSLQQAFKHHKRAKVLWGASSLLLAGAGTYFKFAADGHYDDYHTATNNQKAADLKEQVEQEDMLTIALYSAAGAALIPTIIQAVKQGKTSKKMQLSAHPVKQGAMFSMKINF